MANSNLPRRIIKETQRLLSEPGLFRFVCSDLMLDFSDDELGVMDSPGISASPSEDNMRYFNVMILGPSQSPYEGGVFKLELFLPEEYPMAAPKPRNGPVYMLLGHEMEEDKAIHFIRATMEF
ncbi:hypothetical protein BHE74_00014402 [Ensete ventricosum]|nr:hypothetical protein GW17_00039492 [Ensete ventricosum]RWW77445.1 hypothetical protein BHE74_00014402 [Ensete ventricosum]